MIIEDLWLDQHIRIPGWSVLIVLTGWSGCGRTQLCEALLRAMVLLKGIQIEERVERGSQLRLVYCGFLWNPFEGPPGGYPCASEGMLGLLAI